MKDIPNLGRILSETDICVYVHVFKEKNTITLAQIKLGT